MAVLMQAADDHRLLMVAAGVVRELIKAIKFEKGMPPGGEGAGGIMDQMVRALERPAPRPE